MTGDTDALHLKLDRLLAGQADLASRLEDHDSALAALAGSMEQHRVSMEAQAEALDRLNEAVSTEVQGGASDIQDLLTRIYGALNSIASDASETRVALGRLPSLLDRAAADAARMARGDGVDTP